MNIDKSNKLFSPKSYILTHKMPRIPKGSVYFFTFMVLGPQSHNKDGLLGSDSPVPHSIL